LLRRRGFSGSVSSGGKKKNDKKERKESISQKPYISSSIS
jgi:hypothetical protein